MNESIFHRMLGVGEGAIFFMFSFIFAPLGYKLNMTYGELGDLLTLSIQFLSMLYIGVRISGYRKNKKGDGNDI
tara:strand:- start:2890 stop:3111 length:222 start_codon:yes stop_codon:yes gene_type:complete